MIGTDSGVDGHCGNLLFPRGFPWAEMAALDHNRRAGPCLAEMEDGNSRKNKQFVRRHEGMTEVGGLGELAAWWCLGVGTSAGWH